MVFAADDVRDTEVDVVDHARQQVEPAAVLAAHDRVAEQLGIETLLAADQVVPHDRRIVVEPEAPMRRSVVRNRGVVEFPFVDGRQAAAEQHLAANLQLLGGFVTGVNAARVLQPLELSLVQVEALGLADELVRSESHPFEVVADRLVELGSRTLAVGVVDPEDERPAMLLREQIIVQRGADIADMQPAGRRRCKAGDDISPWAHRGSFVVGPVWKKLLIG
jgi:hypothetical protein